MIGADWHASRSFFLWARRRLRSRAILSHALMLLTLEDAIERHKGEAKQVTHRFRNLTQEQSNKCSCF